MKYRKIGEGRVLRCYKVRITRMYIDPPQGDLRCPCGQVLGLDRQQWYQMKQGAFTYRGHFTK